MKKSNIVLAGAAALVALVGVAGISLSVFAQDNSPQNAFIPGRMWGQSLTDEQRAEIRSTMQAKLEEMGVDTSQMQARIAQKELSSADREARRSEMQANREAVQAAIDADDYGAFAAAIGENSPLAGKITSENFDRFVEAHKSIENGRKIMQDLGIEKGMGRFGGGRWGM